MFNTIPYIIAAVLVAFLGALIIVRRHRTLLGEYSGPARLEIMGRRVEVGWVQQSSQRIWMLTIEGATAQSSAAEAAERAEQAKADLRAAEARLTETATLLERIEALRDVMSAAVATLRNPCVEDSEALTAMEDAIEADKAHDIEDIPF